MRGRSAALQMLKSGDQSQVEISRFDSDESSSAMPSSAPATFLSAEAENLSRSAHATPERRPFRNIGESMEEDQSFLSQELLSRTTSATSSGGSRAVFCIQPLTESNSGKQPVSLFVSFLGRLSPCE